MRKAITVLASVVLTACGQDNGVGVSAEQGNSLDQSSKNGLTRSRELSVGSSAKSTVEIPTAALIVEAANSIFAGPLANEQGTLKDIEGIFAQYAAEDGWTPVSVAYTGAEEADWKAIAARETDLMEKDPSNIPYLSGRRPCVEKFAAGDKEGGQTCIRQYWRVINTAASIVVANRPLKGWPVDPNTKKGIAYSIGAATHAEFANLIETDIASRLKGRVLRDPTEAKAEIVKILYSYDKETLSRAATESRMFVEKNIDAFQYDFTGVKGLAFLIGNGHYQNTGKGWEILKNGVTWFGDGKLSGKSYELSLESSISTNMTKSQNIENSTTGSNTNSSKATAGVK